MKKVGVFSGFDLYEDPLIPEGQIFLFNEKFIYAPSEKIEFDGQIFFKRRPLAWMKNAMIKAYAKPIHDKPGQRANKGGNSRKKIITKDFKLLPRKHAALTGIEDRTPKQKQIPNRTQT